MGSVKICSAPRCHDVEKRSLRLGIYNPQAAYGRINKVKKAVLMVIATQLPEDRIQTLKPMLFSMDKNSDGTLTVLEIEKALSEAGVDVPDDIHQLLKQVDTDGSAVVDYIH